MIAISLPSLAPVGYELDFAEDTGAPWSVTKIQIEESLDNLYTAIIEATADIGLEIPDGDIDKLLGCDAVLTLVRGSAGMTRATRRLYGVVTRLDFLGHEGDRPLVRFHLAPALALAQQRVDSRIWQNQSVQSIVSEVLLAPLADFGRSLDFGQVKRGTQAREYCTQYRESDFDFVSRLLEEEGIAYEFRHDEDDKAEQLVFHDGNTGYIALQNLDDTAELPCIHLNPEQADVESIQHFEWTRRLTNTSVLRRDFDWRNPSQLLSATADGNDERSRVRRIYTHGQRRFQDDDLSERATDLRESALTLGRRAQGRSNATIMRPGLKFMLAGHARGDLQGEYLITRVVHHGVDARAGADKSGESGYRNEFECIPLEVVARPTAKTRKPSVRGPQTAIVTGQAGEEICTDEHGRIHVQFHWQETPVNSELSSCWVRCAQTWAGGGPASQFIPRVGMEVVVEFLEGNPDRPLVTGCVYNGQNPPPYALPEHKTQSGWRTASVPGGDGFNELRFEDAAGSEEIYVHGQKDWTIAIEHDKRETIGNDESNEIGHDHSEKVGNDRSVEVGHDQTETYGHDQTTTVGNNQQSTIGVDRVDTIGSNTTETVGVSKTVVVGTVYAETIGADYTSIIGATSATVVGEDMSLGVGKSQTVTIGENASESVVGEKRVEAEKLLTTTNGETTIESGRDMMIASGMMLTVRAQAEVTMKGETRGVVEMADELVLRCGKASIALKKDGTVEIKGKDLTLKASGSLTAKGSKVGHN